MVAPLRPYAQRLARPFLGFGLLSPFRRDQRSDFAAGSDVELVKSCVAQVLGTRAQSPVSAGEVPWRPEFGSWLHLLLQKPNDVVTQQTARVYVVDALTRWEPRVRVRGVNFTKQKVQGATSAEEVMIIGLLYDLISANVAGNNVNLTDINQTVVLRAA